MSPSAEHRSPDRPFADRLIERARRLGHPLCVGLDPHLDRIPPLFRRGSMAPADPATADAVGDFLAAVLERVAERAAAVKPQIAFFEQLGWRGLRVLETVAAEARRRGVPVILDAKRGDVGTTAAAYAAAYLGPEAVVPVDSMTVNPYLGLDSLDPFFDAAKRGGRGLFVLVKTSNPGSGDFQDRRLGSGGSLYEWVANTLAGVAGGLEGPATGWSSLGVVVGATYPGESERIRERLPRSLFLVPGYGAQGGSAKAAVRGFVPGPGGRLEGGVVSSSRGVLFPPGGDTDDAGAWERAIDGAVERATGELGDAVGR
jgi:orotidine-5'-phosphate decarboxylase